MPADITIAAMIVSVLSLTLVGGVLFLRAPGEKRPFLGMLVLLMLPMNALAFHLIRMPLDAWLASALGRQNEVYHALSLLYAPITEEPAKLWPLLIPYCYLRLKSLPVHRSALAIGLGFGVGEAWTVTKVDRNIILEISNRPALDELLDTADMVGGDRSRESFPFGDWLIGFAVNEYQDSFTRGDFIVRGILGADQERRGVIVGGIARVGQTVQFQLRDPSLAAVDLRQTLLDARASLRDTSPVAAVLFTCNGRGEDMFGRPHHDTETVAALLPGVPLAGMFCNGEVGPAGPKGVPMLNGFTATVALLVPDGVDAGAP